MSCCHHLHHPCNKVYECHPVLLLMNHPLVLSYEHWSCQQARRELISIQSLGEGGARDCELSCFMKIYTSTKNIKEEREIWKKTKKEFCVTTKIMYSDNRSTNNLIWNYKKFHFQQGKSSIKKNPLAFTSPSIPFPLPPHPSFQSIPYPPPSLPIVASLFSLITQTFSPNISSFAPSPWLPIPP